jgi:hypothetical protein
MIAYLVTLTSVFHKLKTRAQAYMSPTKVPLIKSNSPYYGSPSSPIAEEKPNHPNRKITMSYVNT